MDKYNETNLDMSKELIKTADEQLSSCVYLVNLDQEEYGSVVKGLQLQKALQNDQYPERIVESNIILTSAHRFDNAKEYKIRIIGARTKKRSQT